MTGNQPVSGWVVNIDGVSEIIFVQQYQTQV